MEKSILTNCGTHSDKLVEIYKKIIENKTKNGEILSKNDAWNIESNIYDAYKTIIAITQDSNVITKSVNYLKLAVEQGGEVSNLSDIAISVVEQSTNELQNNYNNVNSNSYSETTILATGAIVAQNNNLLEDFFDHKKLFNLQNEIDRINAGDEKAYENIVTFEHAAKVLGKTQIPEKTNLAWMMRLVATDSSLSKDLVIELAKKNGYDILTDNGTLEIDEDKLIRLYQSRMPEGSKASKMTLSDFKSINERIALKAKEDKKLPPEGLSADKMAKDIKKETLKRDIKSKVLKTIHKEGNLEEISDLYKKHPEIVKGILKERIDVCNKMQASGRNSKVITSVQSEITTINEIMQINKEKTISKNNPDFEDEEVLR